MKVNDIITTACRYMHIELPDCCYTDVMTTTLADQLQYNPLLTNLLMCLDTVLSEMNSILPNIAVVNIVADDDIVSLEHLDKPVIEVLRLTDINGQTVPYRYMSGGLLVEQRGSMRLVYSTAYDKCTFLGNIELSCGKLDIRLLAQALCSEYSLLIGDYDNFAMWESRYRASLPILTNKRSGVNMPSRGWY